VANSFTENQAKDRLEKTGFSQVAGLKNDDQGIWQPRCATAIAPELFHVSQLRNSYRMSAFRGRRL
jgi:hypothetical protein